MTTDRPRASKGFTLVEATFALVILGMAAAGVLLPYASGASVQAEGRHRTLGAKLAADMVEQVILTPFEQIVSTWDGYSQAQGEVLDTTGNPFGGTMYADFGLGVTCMEVYVPPQQGFALPQFVLVTVEVTHQGRQVAQISRLIGT